MGNTSTKPISQTVSQSNNNNNNNTKTDNAIVELFNDIIRTLNVYIKNNREKVKNDESSRATDLVAIISYISMFYPKDNKGQTFSYTNSDYLKLSQNGVEEITQEQANNIIINKHIFYTSKLILDSISKYLITLKTGDLGKSALRDALQKTITQCQEKLKKLEDEYANNANKRATQIAENKEHNSAAPFLKLPRDLLGHILLFTESKQNTFPLRISQAVNEIIVNTPEDWVQRIQKEFNLNEEEIKAHKYKYESHQHYYLRIKYLAKLCQDIRYEERQEISLRRNESYGYKMTPESHHIDLLDALRKGVDVMKIKYDQVCERVNRLKNPHIQHGLVPNWFE